MINAAKLKGKIVESETTQEILAKKIGLSETSLNRKINNLSPMTLNEAEAIAQWLGITDDNYGNYFFYKPVA